MKTIKGVELYDSIHEMPISRYSSMNKIIVQDVGFGSTFDSVKEKLANLSYHLEHQDIEASKIELSNLFFSVFSNLEKVDIKSRIFLCMVYKIDGKEFINPEDEDEVLNALLYFKKIGLTVEDVEESISSLKKKLMSN